MKWKIVYLVFFFFIFVSAASATSTDEYKVTYIINVKEDGTATWVIEYRTMLATQDDFDSFENYSQQLESVHLNEFKELMENSVSRASASTLRRMVAKDFTGNAAVQSTPTGTYGVIHYSFTWTNFAKTDSNINIGDVFVGGLYLSRDNTLIIQYPSGYTIDQVTPQPDLIREDMIWYGPRSFGAGEPRIILSKAGIPWKSYVIILIILIGLGTLFIHMRKNRKKSSLDRIDNDVKDLSDRIVQLLNKNGGSLYQSEIVNKLGLPKSTVSTSLNELHKNNIIIKIKKGRENLIRLK